MFICACTWGVKGVYRVNCSYKQLNAAPNLHGVCEPFLLPHEETVPAVLTGTTLAPIPMTVEHVHTYKIRKWHPTQRTAAEQCCEHLCKSEAMKTLSGCIPPRCDKRQLCAKITLSTCTVFKLSLFEDSGQNKERKKQKKKNN